MRNALIALSLVCLSACGGGGGGSGSSLSNEFAGNWLCNFRTIEHNCSGILSSEPVASSLDAMCPMGIVQNGNSIAVTTRAPSVLTGGVSGEGSAIVSVRYSYNTGSMFCGAQDTLSLVGNDGDAAGAEFVINLTNCYRGNTSLGNCQIRASGSVVKQ